jgi:hypothetical protein
MEDCDDEPPFHSRIDSKGEVAERSPDVQQCDGSHWRVSDTTGKQAMTSVAQWVMG